MKKLIAFYILTFSFLLIQDGLMLNVKKNVMKWDDSTSLSIIDLEDETTDKDDTVNEDIKDVFYSDNSFHFSNEKLLKNLQHSNFAFFIKDIHLELLSPPPQLS
ncbi:hypothetical protein V7S76_00780 [Aquirufa sp. ROCK2-A2]